MTAISSLSNNAWAERQRDFKNRTEIIGLPIFTALNSLYIKHGHLIPVYYSVMHVQYLHIPSLNNQFNLQLNLQWQQQRLCVPILGSLAQPYSRSWIFEMCIALGFQGHIWFLIGSNSYNSIHSAHFHMDHFSAHLCWPIFPMFPKIALWEVFLILFSQCCSSAVTIFKFSFLTLLPVCFWSVKPNAPNAVITQVGFHAPCSVLITAMHIENFFSPV